MEAVATEDGTVGGIGKLPSPRRPTRRLHLLLSALATIVLGLVAPFVAYVALAGAGLDITPAMFIAVVAGLFITAVLIWLEGLYALRVPEVPPYPTAWYPPASAIILAPPPDDDSQLVPMVTRLRREYPATLQVILAYLRPVTPQVEETLRTMAQQDLSILVLHAGNGASAHDALTMALNQAQGEFVGIFHGLQYPNRDAFVRAWMWLSNGYDAVHGRWLVSNADTNWVTRLDAVESYAPAYPRHAGDSVDSTNSFWMTEVLRRVCSDGRDTLMAAIRLRLRIATDTDFVSPKLAPETMGALWRQRIDWAGDSFRPPLRNLRMAFRSSELGTHRKIGLLHLRLWRPFYVWLSLQVIPIVAFWVWRHGASRSQAWVILGLLLLILYAVHAAPGQTLFAYLIAPPELRRHKSWFLSFWIRSMLFYVAVTNLADRFAQIGAILGRSPKQAPVDIPVPPPMPRELEAAVVSPGTAPAGRGRAYNPAVSDPSAADTLLLNDHSERADPLLAASEPILIPEKETTPVLEPDEVTPAPVPSPTALRAEPAQVEPPSEGATSMPYQPTPEQPVGSEGPAAPVDISEVTPAPVPSPAEPMPVPAAASREGMRLTPAQVAEQLLALSQHITHNWDGIEAERDEAIGRIRTLEEMQRQSLARIRSLEDAQRESLARLQTLHETRRKLQEACTDSIGMHEVQSMEGLIKSLLENPNHIVYLARVSEHSAQLAAIVDDYARLRRLLAEL